MEATYCLGNDFDVCRMFDQYLYKRSDTSDLSTHYPQPQQNNHQQHNGFEMNDQTFYTPNFGDEEFDIPSLNSQSNQQQPQPQQPPLTPPHTPTQQQLQQHQPQNQNYHQQPPQQMSMQHQQVDNMSYQPQQATPPPQSPQQMYMNNHNDHRSYSPQSYGTQSPYNVQQQQMMMLQQHHQQQQQQQQQQHILQTHGQMTPPLSAQSSNLTTVSSPTNSNQEHTTSDDSDDSTAHANTVAANLKRPSPEPNDPNLMKVQKKPKTQKKKKKRDPNEPQKPVSAYALFFRDTQAAIKSQNPNASFGEVSKIVASMWDSLDSDHKNVYKKKTETAKKEYLKALAAYRASLVSKGATDQDGMYGNNFNGYSPYHGGFTTQSQPQPQPQPPQQQPQQQMNKKQPAMMNGPCLQPQTQSQQHPGMMGSPIVPVTMQMHLSPPHMMAGGGYIQQRQQQQQVPIQSHVLQHFNAMDENRNRNMLMTTGQSPNQQQPQQQQQHMQPSSNANNGNNNISNNSMGGGGGGGGTGGGSGNHSQDPSQQQQQQQSSVGSSRPNQNLCIRNGCTNLAISSSEWEDEYCSNECVVSNCHNVFNAWVASKQTKNSVN